MGALGLRMRMCGGGVCRARMGAALSACLVVLPLSATRAGAQTVRYGVVVEGVRAALAEAWMEAPNQAERAYCVVGWSADVSRSSADRSAMMVDTTFRVLEVELALVREAGPGSVDFECASGVPELHTHTPATCSSDDVRSCRAGGLNAYSCQPSREDLEKLVRRGDPFAVIQCDRYSFRFYYPVEYLTDAGVLTAP